MIPVLDSSKIISQLCYFCSSVMIDFSTISDNNDVASIPGEIGMLTSLHRLYLGKCNIGFQVLIDNQLFRYWIDQKYFLNFAIFCSTFMIDFSTTSGDNAVKSIPSEIGMLTSLTLLDLGRCNNNFMFWLIINDSSIVFMRNIFSIVFFLFSLATISDNNALTRLPSEIGMLTSLDILDLGKCNNDFMFWLITNDCSIGFLRNIFSILLFLFCFHDWFFNNIR